MTTITPERDARNRRILCHSFRSVIGLGLSAEQIRLLNIGTPEDREAYVKKLAKYYSLAAAVIVGYVSLWSMLPRDIRPFPPAPEISDAGTVQSLQLHETALSTSTTVVTATGTYQVKGGGSAALGDVATLKRETQPIPQTSLCIESSIKTRCYYLL